MLERKDHDHRPINGHAGHERRTKDGSDQQRTAETADGYRSTKETRLAETGCLRDKGVTFFWGGKAVEETRDYGVGFAVRTHC